MLDDESAATDGLAATLANWAAVESALAVRFGGAALADERGFRFRSGLTSGFTNGVLRTDAEADAVPALIDDVRAWFPADARWVWLISAVDQPADLGARLAAAGFVRRPDLLAMTLDLAGPRRPGESAAATAATAAEVSEVRTAADLEAWLSVRGANHPLDAATRDAWLRTQPAAQDTTFGQLVARTADGRPVGSMTVSVESGAAGLYHVDVVPDARGRGIGRAMTTAALDVAVAHGARVAVLTATELGLPLYRSLGFVTIGRVEVLAPP